MRNESDGKTPSSSEQVSSMDHLSTVQTDRLTEAFTRWYDSAPSLFIRRVRGRYLLVFLLLRFTGARLGEILRLDDSRDLDFRHSEISIPPSGDPSERPSARIVPVPHEVIRMVHYYLSEFPNMRGKVFALDQGNFRREFYRRAEEAEIPRELSHPHILRHTRAIEMLRVGVPLTTVQDLLGHSTLSTTAIYVKRTRISARIILLDKGLI